jgi:alcohol dehydrogenase (cytochrome c)
VGLFTGGEESAGFPGAGEHYLGGTFGSIPGAGGFAALDMKTNRIVWQQAWKDSCYSGSVTSAGGLVFVGRNDGRLTALNSSTGERVWEFQTGAGVNAPVSLFEYKGEEYIVAYSAGSLFAGTPRGDSVWLFSLKGTMNQVAPAFIPPVTVSAPAVTADLINGQKIFGKMCSGCHGASGEGGHGGGPSLTGIRDEVRIAQMVREGGGQMPSFGSTLTAKDIQDVTAYVRQKVTNQRIW